MACICDDCDEEISLDEANDVDGEVLCETCMLDRDEDEGEWDDEDEDGDDPPPGPSVVCCRCYGFTPARDVIAKNPGRMCPRCAHLYELQIFMPPDHEAAKCSLCTAH